MSDADRIAHEIDCISKASKALDELTIPELMRVLVYLNSRFNEKIRKSQEPPHA